KDEIMVNAKYAIDHLHYLNPDTTLMYTDNRFRQTEVYASVADMIELLHDWNLNVAVDYQYNTLFSTLEGFADPIRHTLMTALSSNYSIGGLSAQGSVMTTSVFDRSWSPRRDDGGPRTLYKRRRTAFTAGLFLNWQPLPDDAGFRVRGFYKRAFRMPTFNDLYYTDMGNARLDPEYATQFDLGASLRREFTATVWRSLDLRLDGYHNRITDKIIAVPKGNSQYRWMMMNIGKVRITGLDFNAEAMLEPVAALEIGGKLAYTWQRALDYTDPTDNLDAAGTYKGQIAYIPEHSGAFTAYANFKGWELNYSFIYVGQRWHNSSNIPENHEEPWYTHDMTLSYTLPLRHTTLRVTAELNNILDQQYEVILNYPMPGRNWRLGLSWDL
ncbi:MAG: TonB-dependent receptor, partial [Muribaculaceae bacterium]|nr:TonB-dependent receptor [Muribaculaceae bacterium]